MKQVLINLNLILKLFGYDTLEKRTAYDDDDEDDDANTKTENDSEEIQIFVNSYKFRVGDASGDKARRDILMSIYMALDIDAFFTVAQKGTVCFWNNKAFIIKTPIWFILKCIFIIFF